VARSPAAARAGEQRAAAAGAGATQEAAGAAEPANQRGTGGNNKISTALEHQTHLPRHSPLCERNEVPTKVLITGVSGMIGSFMARAALDDEYCLFGKNVELVVEKAGEYIKGLVVGKTCRGGFSKLTKKMDSKKRQLMGTISFLGDKFRPKHTQSPRPTAP
jgi:hypothetical protein